MSEEAWRRCSSCKAEIGYGQIYWVCNVSTCNQKRTGLYFCSVSCWEAHLPTMRHREAYAVEKRAPSAEQARAEADPPARSAPTSVKNAPAPSAPAIRRQVITVDRERDDDLPSDILIVASKLKKYIRARSGMNTSDGVMAVLSDHVRRLCDQAIRNAGAAERKTVLDRDFPDPPR